MCDDCSKAPTRLCTVALISRSNATNGSNGALELQRPAAETSGKNAKPDRAGWRGEWRKTSACSGELDEHAHCARTAC
eukprot:15469658-Alexandrium_andersonii.AAC.1